MDNLTDSSIQNLLFESLAETADCFGVFDLNDRLIYCNPSLAQVFGQPQDKIHNQTFPQIVEYCYLYNEGLIIETDDITQWIMTANTKRRTAKFRSFEIDLHDGRWFLVTEQMIKNNFIFFYATDITDKKNTEQKLKQTSKELFKLASTDALTSIHNRRYFLELAKVELKRAERIKSSCSFLMIDIDNFKALNDQYGHQAGDLTLNFFASLIKKMLRAYDIFGRIGGEEFAILLPETPSDVALDIGQRIRQAIEESSVTFLTHTIYVTASIGVATSSDKTESLQQLMSQADKNLYCAKHDGRNSVIGTACVSANKQ